MASYRLISILLAFGWTSACSSGGFGGLTGTKSGDEKKTSQENDENLDGEDGAKEDDPADDPTQVAGAFLTACAPTALPVTTQGVPVDDSIIIGCALIDKESKVKVPGNVELSSVSFELKDGTPFILPSEAAPAESPWHVVGYIARVTYLQIKSITGTAVVEGNPIEAGNDDPNVYDPENKIATIVPPAADPGTDRIRLAASNWFPTASTNYEQAFDDDSAKGWEISRSDFAAATGAWVLFDAGAIYSVRRIEVSFCKPVPSLAYFEYAKDVASHDAGALKNSHRVTYVRDATGAKADDLDPTLPASEARYFRIYVDTDSHKPACINDVKIFGKVLVANSSSGGTSGSQ